MVTIVLARNLGKEEFGVYILMLSGWLIINCIQSAFINQPLLILSSSEGHDYKNNIIFVQLSYSLFVLCLLSLISLLISYFIYPELTLDKMLIYSFALSFLTFKEYIRNSEIEKLNFGLVSSYDFLFLLIVCCTTAIQYLHGTLSIHLIWMNFIIASISLIIIFTVSLKEKISFNLKAYIETIYINYNFAKWRILQHIIGWANGDLYKFIVTYFLGLRIVAVIGACQYVTFLLNPLLIGLDNFGLPFFAKKKKGGIESFNTAYRKYAALLILIAIIMLLPIVISPVYFLKLFYGDNYTEFYYVLRIIAAGTLIMVFAKVFQFNLLVFEQTRLLFIGSVTSFFISIPLLLLLIQLSGFTGLLIHIVLSYLLGLIIAYILYKNYFKNIN